MHRDENSCSFLRRACIAFANGKGERERTLQGTDADASTDYYLDRIFVTMDTGTEKEKGLNDKLEDHERGHVCPYGMGLGYDATGQWPVRAWRTAEHCTLPDSIYAE